MTVSRNIFSNEGKILTLSQCILVKKLKNLPRWNATMGLHFRNSNYKTIKRQMVLESKRTLAGWSICCSPKIFFSSFPEFLTFLFHFSNKKTCKKEKWYIIYYFFSSDLQYSHSVFGFFSEFLLILLFQTFFCNSDFTWNQFWSFWRT